MTNTNCIKIEWTKSGTGYAETKSGKKAIICETMATGRRRRQYYSLFIAGDKTNAATRATLEKIVAILNER